MFSLGFQYFWIAYEQDFSFFLGFITALIIATAIGNLFFVILKFIYKKLLAKWL